VTGACSNRRKETMKLDIRHTTRTIGSLRVFSDARQLRATRIADGLTLLLPAEANFPYGNAHEPCGYLTDVHATLFHNGIEVGVGVNSGFHWGQGDFAFSIPIRLTAAVIAVIERVRSGGSLALRLQVTAKSGLVRRDTDTGVLTMPTMLSGNFDVEFERDRWVDLLRSTGWGENVVLEVALPPQPEAPWDGVWCAVRLAREALDRGGPSGWKACIAECRNALEKWRDIEPLDTGGETAPSDFTRQQRSDVVRQSIHRYTHDAVHSSADRTTRAEAVMVLGTVAGLLGARSSR
jgi:hypothetical protein